MIQNDAARSVFGLAVLLLCTSLLVLLVGRSEAPALAFASSPLSPLPPEGPEGTPAAVWPRVLGVGLVVVGAALVIVGLVWLLRSP
jgi:hypothetical protein